MKTKPANRVDLTFRAVADPTRLRILNMLRGGERCVCEIVDALRCPQPKASRHLAYLRHAGLVSVRKQGLWAYYKLAPARRVPCQIARLLSFVLWRRASNETRQQTIAAVRQMLLVFYFYNTYG